MPSPDPVATEPRARARTPSPERDAPPLRRSTRSRRPAVTDHHDPPSADASSVPERLEQIEYRTPEQLGVADYHARLTVRVHPVAMALMSFHAHLTRTEVIGYLGGVVRHVDDATELVVLAAFPCKELNERALAKTGRSAYTEVELDPANSVEVLSRVTATGMSVIGWYHSHPDENFTVEPSRVDIENQHNYQSMLFGDKPFVAAIIAPYNSDLPDHNPDVAFFRVWEETTPMRLPYEVARLEGNQPMTHTEMVNEFAGECHSLIDVYGAFAKRKRLDKEWRGDVSGVEKMRKAICCLDSGSFGEIVHTVLNEVDRAWRESADADEAKRTKNRMARKRKRARRG